MEYKFLADENDIRIDTFLAGKLKNISRAYVSKLLDEEKILCNGLKCKPSYKIKPGDDIFADIPEPETINAKPQDIPINIIYEDQWLAVIDKPQGMVVHPAPGHRDHTLVNALMHHFEGSLSDINGVIRPGIVHRIDKDTSGLLIVVKNNDAHAKIAENIQRHEVKRTYRALVLGIINEEFGTINLPIGRNSGNRMKNAVVKTGKNAITHFKVLERFYKSNISYLEIYLETGRTHQIRVHLAHLNHPVLGDPLYGGVKKNIKTIGQTLHAYKLEFLHPMLNNDIIVESQLPEYFSKILNNME